MQNGFCFGRCEDHSCQWSVLLMLTFILICYDCRSEFLLTLYYLFTLPENALSASEVWVQTSWQFQFMQSAQIFLRLQKLCFHCTGSCLRLILGWYLCIYDFVYDLYKLVFYKFILNNNRNVGILGMHSGVYVLWCKCERYWTNSVWLSVQIH